MGRAAGYDPGRVTAPDESSASSPPPGGEAAGVPSVDDLVERLRERVAERRASGQYPAGLEDQLEEHFDALTRRGVGVRVERLREALEAVEAAGQAFQVRDVGTESGRPGGRLVHAAVARLVRRHVEAVLDQVRAYADRVADAHRVALSTYDEVLAHTTELERRLERVEAPGLLRSAPEWPRAERSAEADPSELVRLLPGPGRVLSAGPPSLTDGLRSAGSEVVEAADLVAGLRVCEQASLDAVVTDGAVEQLAPAEQLEMVALLADRVRPGGTLVLRVRNPHALAGPGRAGAAPAHPALLSFLLREAGFADVEVRWEDAEGRGHSESGDENGEPVDEAGAEPPAATGDAAGARGEAEATRERLRHVLLGAERYVVTARRS